MKQRVLVFAVALWVTVATLPNPVFAKSLDHYNLDSLVYLADRIVEGEIIGSRTRGGPVLDIRISNILAGTGRPGETIAVAAMEFFQKPVDSSGRLTPLAIGDKLFLFLVRARPGFLFEVPDDGTVLMAVPSGLKLVIQEKAYSFAQRQSPGPYVADLPVLYRTAPAATESVAQLRAAIAVTLKKAVAWRDQFKAAPTSRDAAALLALLRERREDPPTRVQDAIADSAAWRLARLGNPKLMLEMLRIGVNSFGVHSAARDGLGTPEGREILLQRIGDSSVPIAERRTLARMVASVGLIYSWRREIDSNNSGRTIGSTDSDNASYLTRIVRLAATVPDEEVAIALLTGIHSTGFSAGLPQIDVDMARAVTEMIRFHQATRSARVRFTIASLISVQSPKDLARLQMGGAPVLSLASLDSLETAQVRGTLYVSREEKWLRDGNELTAIVLVLEPVDGGRTYVLPVEGDGLQKARAGAGASRSQRFDLPSNIRPGKYRVFFRYHAGTKTAAESNSFETSL